MAARVEVSMESKTSHGFRERMGKAGRRIRQVLETAALLPVLPVLGCGYVIGKHEEKINVHDHDENGNPSDLIVATSGKRVAYDPQVHGEISGFLQEGDPAPFDNPAFKYSHQHRGHTVIIGPWESKQSD